MTGRNDSEFHDASSSRIVMDHTVTSSPITRTPPSQPRRNALGGIQPPNRREIIWGVIVALFLLGFPLFNPYNLVRPGLCRLDMRRSWVSAPTRQRS
jgi:hypothetical protein